MSVALPWQWRSTWLAMLHSLAPACTSTSQVVPKSVRVPCDRGPHTGGTTNTASISQSLNQTDLTNRGQPFFPGDLATKSGARLPPQSGPPLTHENSFDAALPGFGPTSRAGLTFSRRSQTIGIRFPFLKTPASSLPSDRSFRAIWEPCLVVRKCTSEA